MIGQQAPLGQLGEHVGELGLHQLLVRNGFAEELALPGVAPRLVETGVARPESPESDAETRLVKARQRPTQAFDL